MFKRDDGSSLIEVALVLPVLLLLLVGAVDFGRAYFVNIEVWSAAEAGALYGAQNSSDTAGIQAAAQLDAADVSGLTASASSGCECADGSGAVANCGQPPTCTANLVNYVEVDTAASYHPILPYPGIASNYPLTGKVRVRMGN